MITIEMMKCKGNKSDFLEFHGIHHHHLVLFFLLNNSHIRIGIVRNINSHIFLSSVERAHRFRLGIFLLPIKHNNNHDYHSYIDENILKTTTPTTTPTITPTFELSLVSAVVYPKAVTEDPVTTKVVPGIVGEEDNPDCILLDPTVAVVVVGSAVPEIIVDPLITLSNVTTEVSLSV